MKSDPILATAFAHANGGDQGQFVNAMARELFVLCKGQHGFEMQSYEISKALDRDGEAFIIGLAEFIALRKKDIS